MPGMSLKGSRRVFMGVGTVSEFFHFAVLASPNRR